MYCLLVLALMGAPIQGGPDIPGSTSKEIGLPGARHVAQGSTLSNDGSRLYDQYAYMGSNVSFIEPYRLPDGSAAPDAWGTYSDGVTRVYRTGGAIVVPGGDLRKAYWQFGVQPKGPGTSPPEWGMQTGGLAAALNSSKWLVVGKENQYIISGYKKTLIKSYLLMSIIDITKPPVPGEAISIDWQLRDNFIVADAAVDAKGRAVAAVRKPGGLRVAALENGKIRVFERPYPVKPPLKSDYSAAYDVMTVAANGQTFVYEGGKLKRTLKTPESKPDEVTYFNGKVVWQYANHFRIEGSNDPVEGRVATVSSNRKHAIVARTSDKSAWLVSAK
jgi:hypothetical protein